MKIADVRTSIHRVPVKLPVSGKSANDGVRVICEVETDDGHVGVGMTARFMPHAVVAAINHHIFPAVTGMDPRDLEAIHARLKKVVSERGRMTGINLSAQAAVDLALWDIIGKASGRTVAQLLGGHSDRADVYVTFGFGDYTIEQLGEVARMLIAAGHTRLKMLVGVSPDGVRGDVERVRSVREAIGPEILLAVDANELITLDYAVALAKRIEQYDIAWFEDPVRACDARDMAVLRRQTSIPLSAGQMDGHSDRFRGWVEHEAIDIFMPNSMFNGGMTETRRVAHLAAIYNRPLSDAGGGGLYCLHHVAGFAHGTLAEVHLGVEQVEALLFKNLHSPQGGKLAVPVQPGFGIELDRDAMRETMMPT